MDEIIEYLQSESSINIRFGRYRGRSNVYRKMLYAICCDLGSILLVSDDGRVIRKSNVETHVDHLVTRPQLTLMSLQRSSVATILVGERATVSLMYCHRVRHTVDSTCRKIVLLGSSCLSFSDAKMESMANDMFSLDQTSTVARMAPWPINPYELHNGDQIELFGNEHYYLRVSGNKHCFYIEPAMFQPDNVRYQSSVVADAQQNLQLFVNNLANQQ